MGCEFYEEAGSNVNFTYSIYDFVGGAPWLQEPDHAVHSSASCAMFHLDGHKYWKDYDSDDQISKSMLYGSHG